LLLNNIIKSDDDETQAQSQEQKTTKTNNVVHPLTKVIGSFSKPSTSSYTSETDEPTDESNTEDSEFEIDENGNII
jgi:hypothetical protein